MEYLLLPKTKKTRQKFNDSGEPLKLDGLGQQVRQLRQGIGYTGPEFATAIDIDDSTLSKYEQNKRAIPLSIFDRIAEIVHQPAPAIIVWCMRERFPDLDGTPTEVASFFKRALKKLDDEISNS